jgi:ubiquinone/menaquinone biosynthesis C-methylase UbiE
MTYRTTARFYDLFGSKNDLQFYRDLALRSGPKALELGVGTGRVAISLAQAGIAVVGLDNSVHMLRAAKERLAKEPQAVRQRVTLKRGDMRSFELKQTFPFVYLPASTFDHNTTVEDRKQTLNHVYRHLEKGGIFAFDLEQVTPGKPDRSWWIDRKETDDGNMVVRSIFTRRDMKRRRCNLDLFFDVYRNGQLLNRYHEYGEVAIISKDEIVKRLEDTGFEVESVYGDFDKTRYAQDSSKLVLVTRKNS